MPSTPTIVKYLRQVSDFVLLTRTQREVFTLYYVENLFQEEIAERLGITQSAVCQRITTIINRCESKGLPKPALAMRGERAGRDPSVCSCGYKLAQGLGIQRIPWKLAPAPSPS